MGAVFIVVVPHGGTQGRRSATGHTVAARYDTTQGWAGGPRLGGRQVMQVQVQVSLLN